MLPVLIFTQRNTETANKSSCTDLSDTASVIPSSQRADWFQILRAAWTHQLPPSNWTENKRGEPIFHQINSKKFTRGTVTVISPPLVLIFCSHPLKPSLSPRAKTDTGLDAFLSCVPRSGHITVEEMVCDFTPSSSQPPSFIISYYIWRCGAASQAPVEVCAHPN